MPDQNRTIYPSLQCNLQPSHTTSCIRLRPPPRGASGFDPRGTVGDQLVVECLRELQRNPSLKQRRALLRQLASLNVKVWSKGREGGTGDGSAFLRKFSNILHYLWRPSKQSPKYKAPGFIFGSLMKTQDIFFGRVLYSDTTPRVPGALFSWGGFLIDLLSSCMYHVLKGPLAMQSQKIIPLLPNLLPSPLHHFSGEGRQAADWS